MQVVRTVDAIRELVSAARADGCSIGLVPTMGALHHAHVSLMDAARRDCDFTVVSVFVNPTQFGPNEDYERYPRDEAADLSTCRSAGVDAVFLPAVGEMYAPEAVTAVRVAGLTSGLCGAFRPGHFDGVATVVAKLLNIVQPDRAYFGEKDAQQLAVIRRVVIDLDMPTEVVGCPTVREESGLAVSSRNAYLSSAERVRAQSLYAALQAGRARILSGERDAESVIGTMRSVIDPAGSAKVDYVSIVEPATMQPVARIEDPVLLALAVRIGGTRLIDNLTVDPSADSL